MTLAIRADYRCTEATLAAARGWTGLDALVPFLILGYLLLGRPFAHLGVSPVYISEISLALYLAVPTIVWLPWMSALTRVQTLSAYCWCLALSWVFAMAQFARGLLDQNLSILALQNISFHVYPVFLLVGFWFGRRHPQALPKLVCVLAWCHALYGLAYIALLSPLGLTHDALNPDSVPWFGQPSGGACAVLGLLAFVPSLRASALPLLLNMLVVLGLQRRAEWLALGVALVIWAVLSHRLRQLVICVASLGLLLLFALAIDLRVPAPESRGGEISTRALVGRGLAAIDPELAGNLNRDADVYAASVEWRTAWWDEIWRMVHSREDLTLFGPGYGYHLWTLHFQDLRDEPVRMPHSIVFFTLGYTGWTGLAIYCFLQGSLAWLLWKAYRASGQAFGFSYWVLVQVWSLFDVFLETPYQAIPTYLIFGIAAAAIQVPSSRASRITRLGKASQP